MILNCNDHITIENERTKLEPLEWQHLDILMPIILKDPDLLRYSSSNFGTEKGLYKYFQIAFDRKNEQVRYPFAIYDKKIGEYAGSTSYRNISNIHRKVQIGGTWLSKNCQRTGLNRHNKFLMLNYAFEHLQFERVELRVDNRNKQSIHAIEAIGATYEGTLRSDFITFDGYRSNTLYYSILKPEWENIKATIFGNFHNQEQKGTNPS